MLASPTIPEVVLAACAVLTLAQVYASFAVHSKISDAVESLKAWVDDYFVRSKEVDARIDALDARLDHLPCQQRGESRHASSGD